MDSVQYADPETVSGLNLYAYCGNNPVNYTDPDGNAKWWQWALLGLGLAVVIGAGVVATIASGGTALLAGTVAITGSLGGLGNIAYQGISNGWNNIDVGAVGASILLCSAAGAFGYAGGSAFLGGSSGALALAGGGTVYNGAVSTGVIASLVFMSQWARGSWPGDDPTVPPGDGFVWRGPGEIGSEFGEWYNPNTGDKLHPDLKHKPPKGPHWGWRNKIERIFRDLFRSM